MLLSLLAPAALLQGATLLEGATVHTMVPGEEPRVRPVLVEEGRIALIGDGPELPEDLELPEELVRVQLDGKHLFPGLIDGMVHHDMEHDGLYVLSGVVLCRDMGNELGRVLIAAMPSVRERLPGPALQVAGAIFDGVPPATTEAVIVRTAEEVEDKFPRLVERGIQLASFHAGIPRDAWMALIEAAHGAGMQAWGPVPAACTLAEALAAEQDGLCYLEAFQQPGEGWDAELTRAQIAECAASGVAVMPLLDVYAYRTVDQGDDPPILNYLAPSYADWWRADLAQRRALFDEDYLARGAALYERLEGLLRELHAAGVPLVPGSAAPNPWMAPGAGLHDELATWVAAGIPRADVLRLATAGAARALGVEADYGSLEVGKVASALVLDADPRDSLDALREPEAVLLRGRYLDPAFLRDLRTALLDAQLEATARAEAPLEIEAPELPEGRVVLQGRVEGLAFERVVAAEEYWVVRGYDGSTSWVGRMVLAGGVGQAPARHTIRQRFLDGRLDGFELDIEGGGISYRVEGLTRGGQFRLKRWLNGQYVDTNSTPRRPALVDVGMATPAMILNHYRVEGLEPGRCQALYFEGVDPVAVDWNYQRGENGVLSVRTGRGPMVATFEADGALAKLGRAEGKATVRYESVRHTTFGGPGMPPPNKADSGKADTGKAEAGSAEGDERGR